MDLEYKGVRIGETHLRFIVEKIDEHFCILIIKVDKWD